MTEPNTLARTARWFRLAVPNPTPKNQHTQLGCHLEEVAEMVAALDSDDLETARLLFRAERALEELAQHLKTHAHVVSVPDNVAMLDALCDQIVTATGVAHMQGYNLLGGMAEVNASNFSKFVDGQPVFDANQKIRKGPDYVRADLAPYVPLAAG